MSGDDHSFSRLTVYSFMLRQKFIFWMHTDMRQLIALSLVSMGLLLRKVGARRKGLTFVLAGRRVDKLTVANTTIANIIKTDARNNTDAFGPMLRPLGTADGKRFSRRTLILKLPRFDGDSLVEKGVLIVKFTETFAPLYQFLNAELFTKYFRVVLEPSWVGYSLPEILIWTHRINEKVIVFAPSENDFNLLASINSNLTPLTLGPADWVDSTRFFALDTSLKTYDAIYVANFNPMKRVDRYIRAIAKINEKKPEFRAALVCASHGSVHKEIYETLKWAKNKANLSFFNDLSQTELNALMNQAKINVLFSLREGANKGLAEGLFAGLPALLMAECQCGNFRHINKYTGRVAPDAELEHTLLDMAEHYTDFAPNQWAIENISTLASTKILSLELKKIEVAEGREWTRDLLPKVNNPELGYLNPEDEWLLPERENLLNAFARSQNDSNAAITFLKQLCER